MSCCRGALEGRYFFIAQGASPGLIIRLLIYESQRGGTPLDKGNCSLCSALLIGAHSAFGCVYPGFHFGLCPHSTLGYAGVSCLKALVISLNFDALALLFQLVIQWSI